MGGDGLGFNPLRMGELIPTNLAKWQALVHDGKAFQSPSHGGTNSYK